MDVIIISKKEFDSFKDEIIQELSKLIKQVGTGETNTWLRTRDVCKLLNLSSSSIQNLRNSGKLPFIKLEGTILYSLDEINTLLAKMKEGGVS